MRETRQSPHIPFYNESDLVKLTPRITQQWLPAIHSDTHPSLNNISVGHININRLKTNFSLFEAQCTQHYYDILAITETYLEPDDSVSIISIDGFNFYCLDGHYKEGDGAGVYVRKSFKVRILDHSSPKFDNTPEYLTLELGLPTAKILCAVMYRRKEASYPHVFVDKLNKILPYYNNIIIAGDINIDMNRSTSQSKFLCKRIAAHSLYCNGRISRPFMKTKIRHKKEVSIFYGQNRYPHSVLQNYDILGYLFK